MKQQASVTFSVRSLGHMGEGVGTNAGLVVFVEGALPSETVEVAITEKKKRFAKGALLKVIEKSPHRIDPPCPLYSRCGGCQLMHLSYQEQLKAKTKRVKECLDKIGHCKDIAVKECLPSPEEFNWRHKVQLPAVLQNGMTVFGFYERGSHRIVPTTSCMIHVADGNIILKRIKEHVNKLGIRAYDKETGEGTLRHILLKSSSLGKTLVILITNGSEREKFSNLAVSIMKDCETVAGVVENINTRDDNVILGNHYETLIGESFLIDEIAGCKFIVSPASFFQVNPAQAEIMYKTILDFAELNPSKTVLDAYCGVGTMGVIMAKKVGSVTGIECVEDAVIDARKNASLNNIDNASFITSTLEAFPLKGHKFDIVLLNPPRKGCVEEALYKVALLRPSCIIYTSCDPATLARDLAYLVDQGYRIDKVQPFDMFPQTMHVETVVKLLSE